ncbi:hypothetical protein [Mycobacterium sp. DBP42]|uniref:hypothetical protein n=1 Tax=Mycobacterium sp. DBP42 TaxID=2545267 RepID=UPI00110CEBC2|nr:hypothetical protein [Mycobacterium sp. DBP42]TMS46720.1 hypothetical protein E0T84_29510 [Mycobacterium sp. DBP42]
MYKSLADELMERRSNIIAQARKIAETGVAQKRDLTEGEQTEFDGLVKQADELQERAKEIHEGEQKAHELENSFRAVTGASPWQPTASGCPTLLVSPANVAKHVAAMRQGQTYGAIEEARATIQVNPAASSALGGAQAWAQTPAREPMHLIRYAGIPVATLNGVAATMPTFTLPAGTAGVNETTAHAEYDTIVDTPLTAVRHGRWSAVSAAVQTFDPISGIANMHSIAIAKSLDLAAVGDIEAAAGTPVAFNADIARNVRQAVNTVAATVYTAVEDLVLFGQPADIALLQDIAPANGPDAGSVTTRFNGARLYPTLEATAGQITIFSPQGFLVFMSALQSASTIDPKDGSNSFGSWLHSTGVGQGLTGSAIAVDVVTP